LDVIGNGSFSIIRKVRRKTDGVVCAIGGTFVFQGSWLVSQIFAREELNSERTSKGYRKQIVAEVCVLVYSYLHRRLTAMTRRNILKDRHHDHIMTLYDTTTDISTETLEFFTFHENTAAVATSPPLSNKQRNNHTIWHYFLQILQALHHCHHPNGHSRSWSGSVVAGAPIDAEGGSRRVPILH
jgi:serine/threonine protein kinase